MTEAPWQESVRYYERHFPALAFRWGIPPSEREDCLQEIRVALAVASRRFRATGSWAGYARAIAHATAVEYLRRRLCAKRCARVESFYDERGELVHDAPDPRERPEAWIARIAVREALSLLPEREAFVLTAVELEGRSLQEVGATLGLSESRAQQLLKRGRIMLRRALSGKPPAPGWLGDWEESPDLAALVPLIPAAGLSPLEEEVSRKMAAGDSIRGAALALGRRKTQVHDAWTRARVKLTIAARRQT